MGKAVYNWEQIKKEYFTSSVLEAYAYMKGRYGGNIGDSGTVQKNIAGWTEEKKVWIKEQEEKALKAFEEERLAKEKAIIKIANQGEQQAIQIAYALMTKKITTNPQGEVTDVKLAPRDLKTLVEIFRLAQGKPMNIAKNDNTNTNLSVDELIKKLNEQNAAEEDPEW